MAVSTDIVGLGLIGFSVNCLMVVFNTIGIEKKDTDKLAGGWGLAHLSLGAMMVLVGVVIFVLYAGVHGKAVAFKVNAVLLIILALLGFYLAFSLIYPGGYVPF